MLFSIVAGLMVLLVAAFWAYQGFFSSVIMFFEAVIAAMLAFAFHEQLHAMWQDSLNPGLGLPVAFMGIFAASLLVMRIATDKLVPNGITLHLYAERAGGALFGFFSGMILVGAALIGLQMLPLGSSVLGFERFQQDKDGRTVAKGFLFNPDGFTVGLANMLSNDRFGGGNPLAYARPDLLVDLYGARSAPQTEAAFTVPKDCLGVNAYCDLRQIDHATHKLDANSLLREFATEEAPPGKKFQVYQVTLKSTAADPGSVGEIRFRAPQFRLVGSILPEKNAPRAKGRPPTLHAAVGLSDIYTHREHGWKELRKGQAARLVRFSPLTDLILSPKTTKRVADPGKGEAVESYTFMVVFEVPDDPNFVPWYVEFKRGARVVITDKLRMEQAPDYLLSGLTANGAPASVSSAKPEPPETPATPADQPKEAEVGEAPKGRTHVANAVKERTGVFLELPMALSKKDSVVSKCLQAGKFNEGHISVTVPEKPPEGDDAVTEFFVPEGKRLVQVGAEQNFPESLFGKALNYAATVAAQIKLRDADGNEYFAVGVYSVATIGGETIFELQYWPEAEVPERALKKPKKVTSAALKNATPEERRFGYIFLVDPGVKIVSFSAGKDRQKIEFDVP